MNMPELERRQKLLELGMGKDEAKGIAGIHNSNIFIDMTKGIQYLTKQWNWCLMDLKKLCGQAHLPESLYQT